LLDPNNSARRMSLIVGETLCIMLSRHGTS
jgi:hypothetical protein